jgi:hypothetical protein
LRPFTHMGRVPIPLLKAAGVDQVLTDT